MANKNGAQGTEWETYLTSYVTPADRITKRGVKGEADVWWYKHPAEATLIVPAVAWKRLVKNGGKRRKPDGIRDVVTLSLYDFRYLTEAASVQDADLSVALQVKAAERLNVTRTLHSLTHAVDQVYYGAP